MTHTSARQGEVDQMVRAIESNLVDFIEAYMRVAGGTREEYQGVSIIHSGMKMAYFNGVVQTHLTEETAERVVKEVVSQLHQQPYPAYWWVMPSTKLAALGRILEKHGGRESSYDIGMAIDLEHTSSETFSPSELIHPSIAPEELTIEPLTTEDDIQAWMRIYRVGFGLSKAVSDNYGTILRRILNHHPDIGPYYLAKYQGEPVATGSIFAAHTIAGVYEISTHPTLRKHGIGSAITSALLREIRRRGYAFAVLQATQEGVGMYYQLGFRPFCEFIGYLL